MDVASQGLPGYPLHKENRENRQKKIPVGENTGNLTIFPKHRENTGNLGCSSCKFPDSKGSRYFDICNENISISILKLDRSAKSVFVCQSQNTCKLAQGKCAVGHGKHREFENAM